MDRLSPILSAVADPTRRAIIDRLARGPSRVTDVAGRFPMSLNAVSKHLKVLESAGLIRRERRGREHQVALNARPLQEVARWAHRYERYWTERLDRLDEFFSMKERKP
jgi:DNA-binding transcriptional ArsR family regulator